MKKLTVSLSVLFAVLLITVPLGCFDGVGVTGSGNLTTEDKDISGFTKIEAHSGFKLEISRSNTFSVEITADNNLHKYIEVSKLGDTLKIQLEFGHTYSSITQRAKITLPNLYEIDLSGGSQANITQFQSSHDFTAKLSGGSKITGNFTVGDLGSAFRHR